VEEEVASCPDVFIYLARLFHFQQSSVANTKVITAS
jgi:hypothetical protein